MTQETKYAITGEWNETEGCINPVWGIGSGASYDEAKSVSTADAFDNKGGPLTSVTCKVLQKLHDQIDASGGDVYVFIDDDGRGQLSC